MPQDQAQAQVNALAGGALVGIGIGVLVYIAVIILIYWLLFSKAGYSGARAFLMLIPIVNIVIGLMFIFGEWPIQREVNALRQQLAMSRQGQYPPQQFPPNQQYPQQPSSPQYPQQPQNPSNPQYPQYR